VIFVKPYDFNVLKSGTALKSLLPTGLCRNGRAQPEGGARLLTPKENILPNSRRKMLRILLCNTRPYLSILNGQTNPDPAQENRHDLCTALHIRHPGTANPVRRAADRPPDWRHSPHERAAAAGRDPKTAGRGDHLMAGRDPSVWEARIDTIEQIAR